MVKSTRRASGLLLVATVSIFWLPALVRGQTILQSDFTLIDVPFARLQRAALSGHGSVLWADGVFGGHPIFAEGQGGFAHPLMIFWAAFVTPLLGSVSSMNAIHWLLMLIAGAGVFALCQTLGTSAGAACFAMLALVFSPVWTEVQSVLPVSNALAWVPWCLWAMERWLKRPALPAAALLALFGAFVILAGYPQAFHGMITYMAIRLAVPLFARAERRDWVLLGKRRIQTGVMAIGLCSGLAAVQLLPLFELVGHSVRSAGISMLLDLPLEAYFRGIVFISWGAAATESLTVPNIGSLLVAVTAMSVLLVDRSPKVMGHLFAAAVLFQLGCGHASPLFTLLHDHRLLPGLNFFRVAHLYFNIALIGIAVLAAFAIDGLVAAAQAWEACPERMRARRRSQISALLVLLGASSWATMGLRPSGLPWMILAVAWLSAAGSLILAQRRHSAMIPPFLVMMLLADGWAGDRLHPFQFYDGASLADNKAARAIKTVAGWQEYKLYDDSQSRLGAWASAQSPDLGSTIRHMLLALPAMSNLDFGVASLNGQLALPLARRAAIEPILKAEVEGRSPTPVGRRLIDLLSVRFVSVDALQRADFRILLPGGFDQFLIAENTAALPRFRLYFHHRVVPSLKAAIAAIGRAEPTSLMVEENAGTADPADAGEHEPQPSGHLEVLSAATDEYRFRVTADRAAWLFLADANYPGWTASVDGARAPVYTAEILGKAVPMPAGSHEIVVRFVSLSFVRGAAISLLSCGLLIAAAVSSGGLLRRQRRG